MAATAGVRAISGTSSRTPRPLSRTASASRRYSSVLPLPVTPWRRTVRNVRSAASACRRANAEACSSVSASGARDADGSCSSWVNGSRSMRRREIATSPSDESRFSVDAVMPRSPSSVASRPSGLPFSSSSASRCRAPSLGPASVEAGVKSVEAALKGCATDAASVAGAEVMSVASVAQAFRPASVDTTSCPCAVNVATRTVR